LLIGCAQNPAPRIVEAAPQQHSVNRFEIHGSPDKTALLVDSETGKVWRYDGTVLVPVAYKGDSPLQPVEQWMRGSDGKLHKQ
jgi:hypothetical protein